jgi:hypothetical protein
VGAVGKPRGPASTDCEHARSRLEAWMPNHAPGPVHRLLRSPLQP